MLLELNMQILRHFTQSLGAKVTVLNPLSKTLQIMPVLSIYTNLEKRAIPEKFVEEATEAFAQAIGKPKQYIWICIVPDIVMAFGGDCAPCARCEVVSIGNLGEQENVVISKALCDMISSKLSINYDRITINFCDRAPYEVGYKGTTFQVIRKQREAAK